MDLIRTIKIIVLVVVLFFAVRAGKNAISGIIDNNRYGKTYEQGCEQLENVEYENARNSFEKTRGYKDSDELILKSYYLEGEDYFGKGEYELAEKAFEQAGEYKDAEEKRLLSIYTDAERYESEGNEDMAIKRFTDAGDYKDSADRIEKNKRTRDEKRTLVVEYDVGENKLEVPASSNREYTLSSLSKKSMSGTFSEPGQQEEFTFTAKNKGWYSVVVNSQKTTARNLSYKLFDKRRNEVNNWNPNELLGAKQIQINEPGDYTLAIAANNANAGDTFDTYLIFAKEEIDLCEYPIIHDSVEDVHQICEYRIHPAASGKYRFEFPNMSKNLLLDGEIRDSSGKLVWSTLSWDFNPWGHDVYHSGYSKEVELDQNETYKFYLFPRETTGSFTLKFHSAKEAKDISSYTVVNDEITFEGQQNKYTFTPEQSGIHGFSIGKLYGNASIFLTIIDDYDKKVSDVSISSDGGYICADLEEGREYTVLVKHRTNTSKYTLSIGKPAPKWDMTGYEKVCDTIRFSGQQNRYSFTAPETAGYSLSVGPMNGDQKICITIVDSYDHMVLGRTFFTSGDSLHDKVNLNGGEEYTIYVTQERALGPYTMVLKCD